MKRREEAVLVGEQIAALTGLGIGGIDQDGAERIDHLIGVDDPILLLPLILGKGDGEIDDAGKD